MPVPDYSPDVVWMPVRRDLMHQCFTESSGPEGEARRARFAHRCQIAWLDLLATGQNSEAAVWGMVVDAIFDDDPDLAIYRAEFHGLPRSTIAGILEAFS
jgi:hypothetical protein